MVPRGEFKDTALKMLKQAATKLPRDVVDVLREAKEREESREAVSQLDTILENLDVAEGKNIPICQDTGLPIFFIRVGRKTELDFDLSEALEEAVKEATEKVPLRPNVVDPLTRENSRNNTGEKHPLTHLERTGEEGLIIELMLKGAGSENWSRLFMLNPTSSEEHIIEKVTRVVEEAEGQVCPPTIIGVGIGGTADKATTLAKRALLRPLDEKNDDEDLAELEEKITEAANGLGIGPMGLGGKTTALGAKVERAGCHTASLPVALNLQCWAARRSRARMKDGEMKIEVPK